MLNAISGKIRYIAGNDVFRIIVIDFFKISELTVYRFRRSKEIADLYIYPFFTLISDKVDLIIIGFSDLYVIAAGKKFEINNVLVQLARLLCP